jgi:large subunit ribosomal protein L23
MNAHIIKKPVITEKTLFLVNTANTYTFDVAPSASKTQIAETVEKIFNVKVTGVSTVIRNSSAKRTGKKRVSTLVARKKKAMITLEKGQTIALFDISGAQTAE